MNAIADTRGLLALEAVIESGSVSKAADALGWTQPTVHHHLAKLEQTLGASLLIRDHRGSHPTAIGRLTFEYATGILGLCRRLQTEVTSALQQRSVSVRLGAFPTFGSRVLPRVQQRLATNERWNLGARTSVSPRLEITLNEQSVLLDELLAGSLDIALFLAGSDSSPQLGNDIAIEHLLSEPVWLCTAATAANMNEIDLSLRIHSLHDARWAFSVHGDDHLDDLTRRLCLKHGFDPKVGMRSEDFAAIIRMIEADLVVAIVPESALDTTANIAATEIPRSVMSRDIYLASRRHREFALPQSELSPSQLRQHSTWGAAVIDDVLTEIRVITQDLREVYDARGASR